MRKTVLTTCVLILALAGDLAGHGGYYRGPYPSVPPPGGGGSGPTRRPGGPATPGARVGPTTPGPSAGGGAVTTRRKNVAQDHTNWSTWWEFNKQPYLNLRARLASGQAVTGLGRDGIEGDEFARSRAARPLFSEIRSELLPVLRDLLQESDADIVDSAVLAMARVTPAEHAAVVFEDLTGALQHRERSVKQSAILALGVLGHRQAVPLLLEILSDSKEGRRLVKVSQQVDEIQRSLAAIALGYISDVRAIPVLRKLADRTKNSDLDLKASCFLGLGLFQDGQFEIVPFLLDQLGDRRMSDVIRAQIPIALGRLGEASRPALPVLLQMAQSRKTSNPVRQSCIVALGWLAVPEDAEVIEELTRLIEKSNDHASSNFAFIALGEIGARAARDCGRHCDVLQELDRFLLRQLTRSRRQNQLPWAATACALVGRAYPSDAHARQVYADKLTDRWRETRNPEHCGALAVALGLIEARKAGPKLLEALLDSSDRKYNGHVAEALGMMCHEEALPALKELLDSDNDAEYRVQVASALGLMGDLEVSKLLVDEITRAKTLWVTSSVARALGNVGDRTAIQPLIELAQKQSRPALARAFGVVALGLIGEKLPLPWNARVTVGSNYIAAFHAQTEVMDIL